MRYLALAFLMGCSFNTGTMGAPDAGPGEMALDGEGEDVTIQPLAYLAPAADPMDEDMGMAGMGGQGADWPQDEADVGGDGDGDADPVVEDPCPGQYTCGDVGGYDVCGSDPGGGHVPPPCEAGSCPATLPGGACHDLNTGEGALCVLECDP